MNRHVKILVSWVGIITAGVGLFALARMDVKQQRYDRMMERKKAHSSEKAQGSGTRL